MAKVIKITDDGLKKLEEELEYLRLRAGRILPRKSK